MTDSTIQKDLHDASQVKITVPWRPCGPQTVSGHVTTDGKTWYPVDKSPMPLPDDKNLIAELQRKLSDAEAKLAVMSARAVAVGKVLEAAKAWRRRKAESNSMEAGVMKVATACAGEIGLCEALDALERVGGNPDTLTG